MIFAFLIDTSPSVHQPIQDTPDNFKLHSKILNVLENFNCLSVLESVKSALEYFFKVSLLLD
jgi:hypothetical protein